MAYTLLVPLYHKLLFNNRIQVWTRRIFLHVAPRHNSFIWEITSTGVMPIPNLFRSTKPLHIRIRMFMPSRRAERRRAIFTAGSTINFTSLN